jgi:hypothetical protein
LISGIVVFVFLVKDSSLSRETRIRQFLDEDPALSLILAVIHFEWTMRRAIISLGSSPNVVVRVKLQGCHGLRRYKSLWKEEVSENVKGLGLPEVIKNWEKLDKTFRLRHKLVHGVSSCSSEFARERAIWAIESAKYVRDICEEHDIDLDSRLRVRRSVGS